MKAQRSWWCATAPQDKGRNVTVFASPDLALGLQSRTSPIRIGQEQNENKHLKITK